MFPTAPLSVSRAEKQRWKAALCRVPAEKCPYAAARLPSRAPLPEVRVANVRLRSEAKASTLEVLAREIRRQLFFSVESNPAD
jgi:hypothetical protein